MSTKKPALGRGLNALLQGNEQVEKQEHTPVNELNLENGAVGTIAQIAIRQIEANPFQPRTHFEKEALEELKSSIIEHGVIQPITVRKLGNNRYQIISGERRFRASQLANMDDIPAYVRLADDQTMLEMAIVENIQREDLNAIEVALSYQRLIDECNLTQEQLSEKLGKGRSSITNFLRLLNLPSEIQAGLRDKKISMGHARALLAFKNESTMLNAYRKTINEELSVRNLEALTKEKEIIPSSKISHGLSLQEKKLQDDLSFHFRSKIKINKDDNGKGKIVIPFEDQLHLQNILNLLDR